MVLAQQALKDKTYLELYRLKAEAGQVVILDNGAYEGEQLEAAKLLEVVEQLKPTVVVLPDTPGGLRRTIYKSEICLSEMHRRGMLSSVQVMAVLHAEDGKLEDFVEAYKWATEVASWVGFSRLTSSYGTRGERDLNRRALFSAELQRRELWRTDRHHHALGMLQGRYAELYWLNKQGFRSCDSSAPIWRGMCDYLLEDAWLDIPLDLDSKLELSQKAKLNLARVMEACGYAGFSRSSSSSS